MVRGRPPASKLMRDTLPRLSGISRSPVFGSRSAETPSAFRSARRRDGKPAVTTGRNASCCSGRIFTMTSLGGLRRTRLLQRMAGRAALRRGEFEQFGCVVTFDEVLADRSEEGAGLGGRTSGQVHAQHPRIVETEIDLLASGVFHHQKMTQVLAQLLNRSTRR